jgi:hypothetical protein
MIHPSSLCCARAVGWIHVGCREELARVERFSQRFEQEIKALKGGAHGSRQTQSGTGAASEEGDYSSNQYESDRSFTRSVLLRVEVDPEAVPLLRGLPLLSMSLMLSILYTAARWSRVPLLCQDVVRAARDGTIPYLTGAWTWSRPGSASPTCACLSLWRAARAREAAWEAAECAHPLAPLPDSVLSTE